jgi:hypothetical protein
MDRTTWRKAVEAAYLTMARTPRERLRWITVILDVRVVTLTDDPSGDIGAIVECLRQDWRACAMRSGYIKRGTRWAGVVEIDLVHPRLLGGAAKRDLIGELGGVDPATLTADQRLIITHLHVVVDCQGHASPAILEKDIRAQWPGPRRVHSAKIKPDGTVADNLERLASYSTKLKFQYSQSWEGKNTKFFMSHEPEWKVWMQRLFDDVGLTTMVFTSVTSRAAECPFFNAKTVAAQGVTEDSHPLQLIVPHEQEDTTTPRRTQDDMTTLSPTLFIYGCSYDQANDIVSRHGLTHCEPEALPVWGIWFEHDADLLAFAMRFHGEIGIEANLALISPGRQSAVEDFIREWRLESRIERHELLGIWFWDSGDKAIFDADLDADPMSVGD